MKRGSAFLITGVFVAGVACGMVIGRYWAESGQYQARSTAFRLATARSRFLNPEGYRRDSAALDSLARTGTDFSLMPREIRRFQLLPDCIVTFEVRDSVTTHYQLFQAYAQNSLGEFIGGGTAFASQGLRRGEEVTGAIPNVQCGEIAGLNLSMTLAPGTQPPGWQHNPLPVPPRTPAQPM